MSRSCQSATFSRPVSAAPRTTRASPQIRSETIGFRLCGIEDEPFWPAPNGSSTSCTSVRARWRISSANRSSDAASSASALSTSACRSRWRIWVELGAGSSPSRSQATRSTSGIGGGVGADGARELADAHPLERPSDARAVALERERPAGELEPERGRLGVDAVSTPDRQRVAVLLGARDDGGEGTVEPAEDQRAGIADLQRERRVERRPTTSARSGTSALPRRAPRRRRRRTRRRRGGSRASISATRSGVGASARSRIASIASRGTTPVSAHPSSAASSTSSQRAIFASSDQIADMAGRE